VTGILQGISPSYCLLRSFSAHAESLKVSFECSHNPAIAGVVPSPASGFAREVSEKDRCPNKQHGRSPSRRIASFRGQPNDRLAASTAADPHFHALTRPLYTSCSKPDVIAKLRGRACGCIKIVGIRRRLHGQSAVLVARDDQTWWTSLRSS
jgi:hypothetical protein